MLNHHPHREAVSAGAAGQLAVLSPPAEPLDHRLAPGRFPAPLKQAMASLHRRSHQGGEQVIIRFHNGYGAIISEYRLLEGIYEIAPLRFHGPGPDDYEFYFRSHVPDLTWCSDRDEILSVCGQISRLLPRDAL
jgi:hypothetical protein